MTIRRRLWLVPAMFLALSASAYGRTAPPPGSDVVRGEAPPAGRVAPQEDVYRYNGQLIARDTAAERGLACFKEDAAQPMRCYDSETQLSRAEGVDTRIERDPARAAGAQRGATQRTRSRGPRARAASHYGTQYPLGLWQHADFQGWYVGANSYCQWFDLTGFYANNTTSVNAGQHTGYASKDPAGYGAVYGIGAWVGDSNVGSYWNDSFESRSRVCL